MEEQTKKDNILKYLYTTAIVLMLSDQLSKLWIKGFSIGDFVHQGLFYGEQISVIGDFLQITFIENAGMAFGIQFGVWKILLSLFSIVASVFLIIFQNRLSGYSIWVRIGVMLIFAGAVGNLIDRVFYGVIFGEAALFYGKVVDFIQVDIPDMKFLGLYYTHWPVFNVADSCVSVGVVILLIFHKQIPALSEIFPTLRKFDKTTDEDDPEYNEINKNQLDE